MANKTIKGLTVEIGGDTTKLGKALEDVEKKSRDLSSELGSINKLLKLDPGNTELLAQKQKVLSEAVSTTKEKLDTLKEAEKQVQEQFKKGEVSEEQVRALQREIVETTKKLEKYEREVDDAAEGTEELGEEAEQAERESKNLGDTLEKVGKVGLMGLVGAATAAAGALVGIVEATEDYRREMGKLDTAFKSSGHSSEAAYETYAELQSVLGETDQAVEAANHLAQIASTEQELEELTTVLTGVYGTFGASLPIEGLAEATNETIKTGKVTGSLADALNWAAKEGNTFGVELKKNIDFQELDAAALKKLNKQQRAEYEARKEQYKAIEAYNKKVEEAVSAEDKFNIALENCTTEQERQQLIIETLTDTYSEAADTYREVNKEVIASNEATERLNKVWGEVGKKAAPVVTTFKEGIADLGEKLIETLDDEMVEDFQGTIKRGFNFISDTVLPKLIRALEWVIDNFSLLTSLAGGFIAAMAVAKIVSIASTIGTTLVNALRTATTAQKAANAAASANPYVLLAQAIIMVCSAIYGLVNDHFSELREAARENAEALYGLTEAEKAAAERTNEATEAFRSQRDALNDTIEGTQSQFSYLGILKDELLSLADASGKVEEKDRARAEFILGELNQALGTEYSLTGDQIQNYKDLAASIDEVMEKKKAEILLEANSQAYAEALKNKAQAEQDYYTNQKAYLDLAAAAKAKLLEAEKVQQEYEEAYFTWDKWAAVEKMQILDEELAVIQENFEVAKEAYDGSQETLQGYYDAIGQYEQGHMALLEGNTEEASKILSDLGYYYDNYAAEVGYASDEVQNRWEMDVIDAGVKADHIKTNWEKGVEGYTEEMVKESEKAYNEMLEAYADAHADAKGVGEDLSDGLEQGMDSKKSSLITKARNMVSGIISAMRKEADSHSPSRKMIAFGEDMGEGGEIGLESKTKDLKKVALDQVDVILDAYGSQDRTAGHVLSGIAELQATAQSQAYREANDSTVAKLDSILAAIQAGQIIMLDGEALVGGTADRMNSKLGQIQLLTARGAL